MNQTTTNADGTPASTNPDDKNADGTVHPPGSVPKNESTSSSAGDDSDTNDNDRPD
jgi:hypothetical protein